MAALRRARMEDLCELVTDGTHDSPKLQKDGVPFIKGKNISGGTVDFSTCDYITVEDHIEACKRVKPQRGDILFSNIGSVGDTAFVKDDREFSIKNVALFRPDGRKVGQSYFYYMVLSPEFRSNVMNVRSGSAQPFISLENLRSFEVSYAEDMRVQQRIAEILSAYDDLIENSQKRIRILETMARALYREWFVQFRFPGHEKVPRVASPLGDIPQGWEVRRVEEIVKRISVGKKYDQKTVNATGTVPVFDQGKSGIIGYHDDEPGVVASEAEPVVVFANHTCYQRIVHFSFSSIQNVLPFISNPSLPRNIYWLHWATNGLVVFNDYKGHWPEFASKHLVVPPYEFCKQFGTFVAPLSLRILKLERIIENTRRTRDLLLPHLLSGQVNFEPHL